MSNRAVLYVRVSRDDRANNGRNLAGQLDMCREYAFAQGWRVVEELAEDDRGASGASFDLPQLNRALEMARAEEFEVLVVRELDRFARTLAKRLIVEGEFKPAGVEVDYVLGDYADTPEGNLLKHVRAVVAEYERLKIVERMTRGRRNKVKAGNVSVAKQPPYGYRVINENGKERLQIDETEARVVRLIFQLYTDKDRKSLRAVTQTLTDMRIPTWCDTKTRPGTRYKKSAYGTWSIAAVRQILVNETYIGIWRFGKAKTIKGKTIKNSPEHLIPVEVPAIVDRKTWQAAQARLEENRKNAMRNSKYDYLMATRLTCQCGLKIIKATKKTNNKLYRYYRCPSCNRLRYSYIDCNLPSFRGDQVDDTVWEWVTSFLTDPETLVRGLETYQAEREKENEPLKERLKVVEGLLSENNEQLERLLDLYLNGDFSKEMLLDRKKRLEETVEVLAREKVSLVARLEAQAFPQGQTKSIQAFAARIAKGLEQAKENFEAQKQIIEDLDVRATLTLENDQKVIYARCVLGQDDWPIASNTT